MKEKKKSRGKEEERGEQTPVCSLEKGLLTPSIIAPHHFVSFFFCTLARDCQSYTLIALLIHQSSPFSFFSLSLSLSQLAGPSQSDRLASDVMSSSSSSNCYSSAHTSSNLRGLMVQSTSPSSASSSSSTIANTIPQFTSPDLNVINSSASNSNQVHPIFAISPASGITYSWISPPKSLPRKRTVFSRSQRIELEKKFQAQVRCHFFSFFFLPLSLSLSFSNTFLLRLPPSPWVLAHTVQLFQKSH